MADLYNQFNEGSSMSSSRFIITVIGIDKVCIVAGITRIMAQYNVNIVDITQTIMDDLFTMIMLAQIKEENFDLAAFQQAMSSKGQELGVEVKVQHEDAFRFMHRI
jgi:ACT domain-containing protein